MKMKIKDRVYDIQIKLRSMHFLFGILFLLGGSYTLRYATDLAKGEFSETFFFLVMAGCGSLLGSVSELLDAFSLRTTVITNLKKENKQ